MINFTNTRRFASGHTVQPGARIHRGCLLASAVILSWGFSLASTGLALAQDSKEPMSLDDAEEFLSSNDWRPLHKKGGNLSVLDDPAAEPVTCADGSNACPEEGGTYMRDPYYRIRRIDGNSQYDFSMVSDSNLNALLRAYKDGDGNLTGKFIVYDAISDSETKQSILEINSDNCKAQGEEECFEISPGDSGTGMGPDLIENLYVWREFKSVPEKSPVFGTSKFQEQPPGLLSAQHCFDVTEMDMNNFNGQWQGCSRKIFAELKAGDTGFDFKSFNDKTSYVVPFGWNYVSTPQGTASMHSQMMENENQLIQSESRSVGWKTGLNLVILDFSVMHNKKTQQRSEQMYQQKLVYTKQSYLQTHYALVLDKFNAKLNPEFEKAIQNAAKSMGEQPQDGFWEQFLVDWGTHYSYATTIGERGYIIDKITDSQVMQLHEEGVSTSSGMSAGINIPLQEFGIPGSAGMSASSEDGQANEKVSKIRNVLGKNDSESVCVGGSHCSGRGASGSPPFAPVLLDLRPISDLLAPPFFEDIENLPALRKNLAKAISDYAFEKEPSSDKPSAEFLRISGLQITRCRWQDTTDKSKFYEAELDDCKASFEYLQIGNERVPVDVNSVTLRPYSKELLHDLILRADVIYGGQRFLYDYWLDFNEKETTECFTVAVDNAGKTFQVWGTAQIEVLSAGMLLDPAVNIPDRNKGIENCPINRV